MSRTTRAPQTRSDRAALRRRVLKMIRDLNAGRWDECFETIDPRLRAKGAPDARRHADQLGTFRETYGRITPWHIRISLHPDAAKSKTDTRPFAYVYVVWKDAANEFHLFRERWVKDGGKWYTRVVGLVPAKVADVRQEG
jgi:hypothetical protein